jgi:hypothetical protein
MEWDEVASALSVALKDKDTVRVTTLLKKAAVDYNDNEFLNSMGYRADFEGMIKFGEEILVKQLGMNRQQMLQVMNDISYINEDRAHYETSRMVGLENGVYRWRTPEEHAAAVANENTKKNQRSFLQNTNRLGFGGEGPAGDYKIALSGKLTIAAMQEDIINRITRGEMNTTALARMAEDIVGLKEMVTKGLLSKKAFDAIITAAVAQKVPSKYGDLYKTAKILR